MQSHDEVEYTKKANRPENVNRVTTWLVKGADPNCDLGGSHHTPTLGIVRGTLAQALAWAKNQNQCRGWGGFEATITEYPLIDLTEGA